MKLKYKMIGVKCLNICKYDPYKKIKVGSTSCGNCEHSKDIPLMDYGYVLCMAKENGLLRCADCKYSQIGNRCNRYGNHFIPQEYRVNKCEAYDEKLSIKLINLFNL